MTFVPVKTDMFKRNQDKAKCTLTVAIVTPVKVLAAPTSVLNCGVVCRDGYHKHKK